MPLLENDAKEEEAHDYQRNYQGYEPVYPADFPFEDDLIAAANDGQNIVDSDLLCDNAGTSKSLVVLSVVFCAAFIAILVWQVLVGKCLVTNLCDTLDQSSNPDSEYLFRNFQFRTPSALLWLNLTAGTFGLLLSSMFAIFLLRKTVGNPKMAAMATVVRKGSNSFLAQQYLAILGPVALLSIAVGIDVN